MMRGQKSIVLGELLLTFDKGGKTKRVNMWSA